MVRILSVRDIGGFNDYDPGLDGWFGSHSSAKSKHKKKEQESESQPSSFVTPVYEKVAAGRPLKLRRKKS